jgi:hypothetical protein
MANDQNLSYTFIYNTYIYIIIYIYTYDIRMMIYKSYFEGITPIYQYLSALFAVKTLQFHGIAG